GLPGNDHPVLYPYGLFNAKDGPFNLAVATEDMWPKLCKLLGVEHIMSDPKYKDGDSRAKNRAGLKKILNERFAARGKLEWTQELVKLGIPSGPIFTLDQVFKDPQVADQKIVEEIDHPQLGRIRMLANPIRMDGTREKSVRTPPPALGEHSRQVARELGISD